MKTSEIETKLKAESVAGIPQYLRFDCIRLDCEYLRKRPPCEGTIGERFEWVQMILQSFNQAITGSKFQFLGTINKGKACAARGDFKGSYMFLDQIDKLLQIFTQCRAYKFYIESHINENTSTNVLAAIFQFDAIVRCSKITVEFNFGDPMQTRLPIEAIGNWLNRTNANGQNERFMKLEISYDVPNISEMFEYLKEVYLFSFVKLLHDNYFISASKKDWTRQIFRSIYKKDIYGQALPHRCSR